MRLQAERVQVQDQGKAAAKEGQDQRVGHRADHIAANIHAGTEELTPVQRGIDCVNLGKRGGNAHCHVHHCAERADDDAADQQTLEPQRNAVLPQLQERLDLGIAQAVDLCKCLGKLAEQQRNAHAENRAEQRAGRFARHAAEQDEADRRSIRTYEEDRQKRRRPLH